MGLGMQACRTADLRPGPPVWYVSLKGDNAAVRSLPFPSFFPLFRNEFEIPARLINIFLVQLSLLHATGLCSRPIERVSLALLMTRLWESRKYKDSSFELSKSF